MKGDRAASAATGRRTLRLMYMQETVAAPQDARPLVTIVLPAFNEAALLEDNMDVLQAWLAQHTSEYRWEVIVVNDGSRDDTGRIAHGLRQRYPNLRVIDHPSNFGLGQAFKTAFAASRGDYVVTMDIDLSYGPEHIGALLAQIRRGRARLVLASPYMRGGQITNVPWLRRFMSVWANRFLAYFARGNLSTITCMTRAYEGAFIRSLVLRSTGMDVMPETVYKAMILRARIDQIPAHLDWSRQIAAGPRRRSSMRILRHILATTISGFIFRPFMFFVLPGLVLLAFGAWVSFWMVVHFLDAYAAIGPGTVDDRISAAVAQAYQQYPHTFIVGLLAVMLAVQLLSLGILALQSKSYFEEVFHLGSAQRRAADEAGQRRSVN
jgi:glycosyltransferase involved in cell wall biosynthesis